MKTLRTLLPSALVAVTVVASPTRLAAASDELKQHKELSAAPGGTLTLDCVVGSIEIKTHSQNTVVYDGELEAGGWFSDGSDVLDRIVFDFADSDGDAKISMKWKNNKAPRSVNLKARHVVLIPSRYHVDVRTAGGRIEGGDIQGNVAARSSGGRVQFGDVDGDAKIHTSGGSITLVTVKGDAEVHTSGGQIDIGDVSGDLLARTSGGGISVGSVSGELKGRTSGGSIRAEVPGQLSENLELTTSGGSIHLLVPGNLKADLDASTSGGSVVCDLPMDGSVKKRSIDATVNGGGPNIRLRTSGGSITVAQR